MSYKVYLAGPISGLTFQEANQWRVELAEELAELGIESFNPLAPDKELDDGRIITHTDCPEGITGEDIFNRDVAWINESDLVVANFNAPHFSPGTMWELGYAYAMDIPIVTLGKEDQISHPFVHFCTDANCSDYIMQEVAETIKLVLKVFYS